MLFENSILYLGSVTFLKNNFKDLAWSVGDKHIYKNWNDFDINLL